MKLPEFRSSQDLTAGSRSTSMSGAFMTPQLRGQTERHVAAKYDTSIRSYNAEVEAESAMAKYGKSLALVQGASQLVGS